MLPAGALNLSSSRCTGRKDAESAHAEDQVPDLLETEDDAERLRREIRELKEIIKEVQRIKREQENLRARTENPRGDANKIAQDQNRITKDTENIANKLGGKDPKNPNAGNPAGGADDKAEPKPESKPGDSSPEMKPETPESKADGKPGDSDGMPMSGRGGMEGGESKPSPMESYLPGFEEIMKPTRDDLYGKWDAVTEREKRSRTLFAQETIKPDEVAHELRAAREAVGSGVDVASFVKTALRGLGAVVSGAETIQVDLSETPLALKDALSHSANVGVRFTARFEPPARENELVLTRSHPLVESLSNYVMETALDPLAAERKNMMFARRCGAIRTKQVERRTTLLLVRMRYHIITMQSGEERPLLAEDVQVLAFRGASSHSLLGAEPDANIAPEQAGEFVGKVIAGFDALRPQLDEVALQRGQELLDAHQRVRKASKARNVQYRVEPQLPPDVLGIYVYLPKV